MGSFNTVEAEVSCPRCRQCVSMAVQFKFGDIRQYEYRIGDRLILNEREDSWAPGSVVLAEGVGGPCPECAAEFLDFDVRVSRGVLDAVLPHSPDVAYRRSTYVVVAYPPS